MRTVLTLAVAIAASPLIIETTAAAQQQPRDTTISINVTRMGRAPADRVSIYFGVEAVAETAASATERLQSKIKAIQDSTKRISPTTQVDQPLMMGVAPNTPNGYPPPQSPLSLARAAIRVTLTKLTDLPALQTAASQAGATMSTGASYESSTTELVWKMKASEALESARATAEMSAATQGYKLGRLLTMNVSGGPQNNGFQPQVQLNFEARNNYAVLVAPEISVNATVSLTYLLVHK